MKEQNALRIPIENFIVQRGQDIDHIIYFDPQGQRFEVKVPSAVLSEALNKLDGHAKAIHRSTGGIINAQPAQLILYHSVPFREHEIPEFRIKVRFRDFRPASIRKSLSGEFVSMTKILAPHEIVNPFQYQVDNSQRYALDFGRGTAPIFVFAYITAPTGESIALFVDRLQLEHLIRSPRTIAQLQRYKAPRDALRLIPESKEAKGANPEWDLARQMTERLSKSPDDRIPESLKLGPALEVRSGATLDELKNFLRSSVHRWTREQNDEYSVIEHVVGDDACITSDIMMYMEPA